MRRSRLRSTATKKMSFRVARLIAGAETILHSTVLFRACFDNAQPGSSSYSLPYQFTDALSYGKLSGCSNWGNTNGRKRFKDACGGIAGRSAGDRKRFSAVCAGQEDVRGVDAESGRHGSRFQTAVFRRQ